MFSSAKKSHAHLQYTYNICANFKIDCLKNLGGVEYTKLLLCIEASKLSKSKETSVQGDFCEKFKIDCLTSLGGVDYTNFLGRRTYVQTDRRTHNAPQAIVTGHKRLLH